MELEQTNQYPDWMDHMNKGVEEHLERNKRFLVPDGNMVPTMDDRVRYAFVYGAFCESEYSLKKACWWRDQKEATRKCFWDGFRKGTIQGCVIGIILVIAVVIFKWLQSTPQ